ncbi:MAG TPA: PTS sugar transporter subunit IIA [Glaciihabitans sp.]|jgi:PTS system mannitol-specific IIA component|nr:PTS sugar transporter subunit IIA [Glaciihabitans sp.]
MIELTRERLRELLPESSAQLNATAVDRDDAIRQAGQLLHLAGAVTESYGDAMLERERSVSTYVGEGIAMPHGTLTAKTEVIADALVLLRFPEAVDWNGEQVTLVIGIAAQGRRYIALLSQLASVLLQPVHAASIRSATSVEDIYDVFASSSTGATAAP